MFVRERERYLGVGEDTGKGETGITGGGKGLQSQSVQSLQGLGLGGDLTKINKSNHEKKKYVLIQKTRQKNKHAHEMRF